MAGLITFMHEDGPGHDPVYDATLRSFIAAHSESIVEIQGDVNDLPEVSGRIVNLLREAYHAKGSPITVLVDMTCCPKYYLLVILGACIREGLSAKIHFVYSGGTYVKRADEGFAFTRGEWNPVVVPYFAGLEDPEKTRFFVPALGFEGQLALRFISKYEPDRISLLYPDPGFTSEYTEQAWTSNLALKEQYKVPDEQILRAHAADAVGAWKVLDSASIFRPESENTTYLCVGTKPHALAQGLKALVDSDSKIVYNRPKGFARRDHRFNGQCWLYTVEDLSLLP